MVDGNPGEGRRKTTCEGHCGIGERCGRREPVSRSNREPDQPGNALWGVAQAPKDGEDQRESGDKFREPLRRSTARSRSDGERRQVEHKMCNGCADYAAQALHNDVGRDSAPWELPTTCKYQ